MDHMDHTVVVSTCLVFLLLARNNSRALVTDYHPIVWCDWSSSRDERWFDGDIAGYSKSIVMNPYI